MFGIQHRMRFFLCNFCLGNNDIVFVGQPPAGIQERLIQIPHHQVDRSARRAAYKAAVGVPAHLERHRGMVVVVEWAQTLVPLYLESKSLRDPLNR